MKDFVKPPHWGGTQYEELVEIYENLLSKLGYSIKKELILNPSLDDSIEVFQYNKDANKGFVNQPIDTISIATIRIDAPSEKLYILGYSKELKEVLKITDIVERKKEYKYGKYEVKK